MDPSPKRNQSTVDYAAPTAGTAAMARQRKPVARRWTTAEQLEWTTWPVGRAAAESLEAGLTGRGGTTGKGN